MGVLALGESFLTSNGGEDERGGGGAVVVVVVVVVLLLLLLLFAWVGAPALDILVRLASGDVGKEGGS